MTFLHTLVGCEQLLLSHIAKGRGPVRITEIIWKTRFREKFLGKHGISTEEVEDVIFGTPFIVKVAKGKVKHEDVYEAFGQTQHGRYLVVFFIHKTRAALPISARDMTVSERRYYEKRT